MALQSGPALTLRSISRRLYQQPERHGAVGDGIADDGPAVRNCALACLAAGVAMELTRGKVYLCATWTALDTILPLYIHGNDAMLKGPVVRADFGRVGSPIIICRDTRFDHWQTVLGRALAQTGSIDEFKFTGNTCSDTSSICLFFERPIASYRITGNKFLNTTGGYVVRIGTNDGTVQDTWKDGWICNNQFKGISGTTPTAAVLAYGLKLLICDNLIEDVNCSGASEAWGIYTKVRYGQYCRNTIRNITNASHVDIIGINIKGLNRSGANPSSTQGFDSVCTDNIIENVGTVGSRGACIRSQCDDALIANNLCSDGGFIGITVDADAGTVNTMVVANRVIFSAPSTRVGIYYENGGSGHTCISNIVRGANAGIRLQTGSLAAGSDYLIQGNTLEATAAAIVSNSTMAMNRVRVLDNTLMAGARGFLNDGTAAMLTNWEFRGNDFSVATTSKFQGPLPITVRMSDNKGYMEGSASYDPPSLADGVGVTTTVSCVGAALGDFARAAFSVALAGITMNAWVSAANVVSVRFQNESGGVLDLANGTLVVSAARI